MSQPVETTAPGLPAELWRPVLEAATPLTLGASPAAVVVVVPHPDDETLGPGGLLHRFASTGTEVTVVFVTDGAGSYPGITRAQVRELVRLRRDEARAALETLGVNADRVHFLDLPDGAITGPAEAQLAERLGPLLLEQRTDLCLAPWQLDPHPDHQAVGRAAVAACAAAEITLWQYPIWMRHSLRPDELGAELERLRVHRLTASEHAVKEAAIAAHASQLRSPFDGYGPVLPDHVLALFADGHEPFFVPAVRNPSTVADFEARYQQDGDPWGYLDSWYERRKYAVTLACLPRERYRLVWEPACSIGVLTGLLAQRADRIHASDGSATAIAAARESRLPAGAGAIDWSVQAQPARPAIAAGSADLVMLSEFLYYLPETDRAAVLDLAAEVLAPEGDLVVVHWRPFPDDAHLSGDDANAWVRSRLVEAGWSVLARHDDEEFVLDVLQRR